MVFLLLSVFAVGTLNIIDTVDAATWKEYKSGKFQDEYPAAGYKNISSYQSYTSGNNNLYVNLFAYQKNNNKKKLTDKLVFQKKNNIIKLTQKNYFSGESEAYYYQTNWNVKRLFTNIMKSQIDEMKIPIEKKAADKKTFSANNNSFKAYGIKYNTNYISAFVYKNNEEYRTFTVTKEKNIVNYKEYNQKRKLVSNKNTKTSKTAIAVYKTQLNKLINRIKT